MHRVIKLNQKACLKPVININTKLRKKNQFGRNFLKLMNFVVFGNIMESVRKQRDIKHVTTKAKRNYLVAEPNYHTTKLFSENLLIKKIKKKFFINKPVCQGYQY